MYAAHRLFSRNREIQIDFDPARVSSVQELPYEQIPFDSADWKRSCAERRGFMIDDLLDSSPEDEPGPDDRAARRASRLPHVTRRWHPRHSLFPIDDDWLVVSLNQDGSLKADGVAGRF